jgi:hypothetical protein
MLKLERKVYSRRSDPFLNIASSAANRIFSSPMKTSPFPLLIALANLWVHSAIAAPPVADPKVWLQAERGITLDAQGGIERWADQSGHGNDFEQPTASRRPVVMEEALGSQKRCLVKLPRYQNGNSTYTGTVGLDFVVDEEIVLKELAAFDHLRDGFSGTITVQLRQRLDGGTSQTPGDDTPGAILEQLTFTPASPGELDGPYRWKALAAPRILPAGSYTLLAWGYSQDSYYNSSSLPKQSLGSGVRWLGTSRHISSSGEWPTSITTLGQYGGAMNLRFENPQLVSNPRSAVRFDGIDDGLAGISGMNIGRPSSVFVVFEGESDSSGYVLQNTTGGSWWIRNDGFGVSNYVRSRELGWGAPHVAGMVSTTTGTRAYLDFDDVTANGGLTGANPNRLHLGGGGGRNNDPLEVKIAEVLVYDRQLSESEIWETQAYLAERYSLAAAPAETPLIAPASDLGSGDVTVTLSSGTPGATIRYTTDGSDPTLSSAIYQSPFNVARGTQVRAKAYLAGRADSGISSRYYGDASVTEVPASGLSMWLRADRGIETDAAGNVSRWQDLTGNGNDMEQGASWQRPSITRAFARNGGVAIQSVAGRTGASTHSGTLGSDFDVTEPIVIDQLGAFDHLGDGFSGSITVQIRVRDHAGTPASPADDTPGAIVAESEFTTADPGILVGATRFKSIPAVTLPVGSYSILAWGFTGANFYPNSNDGSWLEDGIRFVNSSRYGSTNGAWPTTLDSHPVKYNGAGNFHFHKASTPALAASPAVEFDGSNDGLLAAASSFISRPSTVYLVFAKEGSGRILQNSGGGSWFISSEGIYADGWVRNRAFPNLSTQIVGITHAENHTRAYVNGEDWTLNPNTLTVAPGRLALGGGSGQGSYPITGRVAELLAFDHELDADERWQVENYLAARYAIPRPTLPSITISPEPSYGNGEVTVTLAVGAPGATIRYTTNGSEPNASSELYTGPFDVVRGSTVKARAFATGYAAGPVSVTYYGDVAAAENLPVMGAKMWLRSDAGLEIDSDGGVTRWRDLTGNGNDVIQPAASQRPSVHSGSFSQDSQFALRVPEGDGSSTWAGTLAEDFVVDQEVLVTHLGAFDHLKDGFSGTVTLQLWSRDDRGTP